MKKKRQRIKIEPSTTLNAQQDRFCQEYIIDYNATKAASRAGYSERTSGVQGCTLLKNPKVLARVRELQQLQAERLAISADDTLVRYASVMRRKEKEQVVASETTTKIYRDEKGRQVREEHKKPVVVEIDPKLSDVLKAGELIDRRLGAFNDKLDISAKTPDLAEQIKQAWQKRIADNG